MEIILIITTIAAVILSLVTIGIKLISLSAIVTKKVLSIKLRTLSTHDKIHEKGDRIRHLMAVCDIIKKA